MEVSREANAPSKAPPLPPLYDDGLVGLWPPARGSALPFLEKVAQTSGDVARFRLGPMLPILVSHPKGVQRILVDHNRNYDKKTRGYDTLRLFLGNGLLTSEGDFWRRQRRIAQPAFHRQRIAGFHDTIVGLTQQMLAQWRNTPQIDMEVEMSHLTLQVVAKTLLSADVDDRNSTIGETITALNAFARRKMNNPLSPPATWPTPQNRRFFRKAEALDEVILDIIKQRRAQPGQGRDLISMLMEVRDAETGESMSDQQLRDEAMTIFVAGHETTANALSWTFYLLAKHPEVMDALQRELASLQGRPPAMEDLGRLDLLGRVIKESMRLFPPAWSIGRRTVADDEIGGFRIPAGTIVIVSPWVIHRRADLWPRPLAFDPDRFLPEAQRARHRYAYFPFGGGPRLCIGNNFALLEAQLVLAMVLQHYRPELVGGAPIQPQPLITLRPRDGIPMRLSPAS